MPRRRVVEIRNSTHQTIWYILPEEIKESAQQGDAPER
jgi:hypothetical protein